MKKSILFVAVMAIAMTASAAITNVHTYQTNLYRTEVIWNGTPASGTMYSPAFYDVEKPGTYSDHVINAGALPYDEMATGNAKEYSMSTYQLFNTLSPNDDFEGIAYTYTSGIGYYMLPGTWYVGVLGYNKTTGKDTEAEVIVPFTIVDYKVDAESITFVPNSTNTKATINLTVPEMLDGNWLDVWVLKQTGENTYDLVYESNGTATPSLPLTVDIEEGKVYLVGTQVMAPLDVELQSNPTPNGYVVNKEFAIGENLTIPLNLNVVVESNDEATFTWEAAKDSPRYRLVVTNSENEEVLNEVINGKTFTQRFRPDTYNWTVTAMVFNTDTYEFDDDAASVAAGAAFTTVDVEGPVIDNFTVKDVTTNSAILVLDATDNWDAVNEFSVTLWWSINGGTAFETPNIVFNENGELPLVNLSPATQYNIAIAVKDKSGNQDQREVYQNEMGYDVTEMKYVIFTTLDDQETGLQDAAESRVMYLNGIVYNPANEVIRLFNAAGQMMVETNESIDMQAFANGVYVIRTAAGSAKIVK